MFKEVAKRKKISDWRDVLFLLPWEFESFVLKGVPNSEELKERRRFSCLEVTEECVRMMVGNEARRYFNNLQCEERRKRGREVQGQCAYAGRAKGVVKIIHEPSDMKKMKPGCVLVSQATSPNLLPAMKQAAAIVTNTGVL